MEPFADRKGEYYVGTVWVTTEYALGKHMKKIKRGIGIPATRLCATLPRKEPSTFSTKLVQFLMHPNSKVTTLNLRVTEDNTGESDRDVHDETHHWEPITEVFKKGGNNITHLEVFVNVDLDQLMIALCHPNNKLRSVQFRDGAMSNSAAKELAKALRSSHNKLENIAFWAVRIEAADLFEICLAVQSEYCKVKEFDFNSMHLEDDRAPVALLEAMMDVSTCQLQNFTMQECSGCPMTTICRLLAKVMKKHGNRLKTLILRNNYNLTHEESRCLFDGIGASASVLAHLDLYGNHLTSAEVPALVNALKHSTASTLKVLDLGIGALKYVDLSNLIMGLSQVPACCLEHFRFGMDFDSFSREPGDDLIELLSQCTTFIKSPSCRLRSLEIEVVNMAFWVAESLKQLLQAVRTSNITHLWISFPPDPFRSWLGAFNKRTWFPVVITLLSIKQVPRLARNAPCRVMPFDDFIFQIEETLGWPMTALALDKDFGPEVRLRRDESHDHDSDFHEKSVSDSDDDSDDSSE